MSLDFKYTVCYRHHGTNHDSAQFENSSPCPTHTVKKKDTLCLETEEVLDLKIAMQWYNMFARNTQIKQPK